jgi:NADH-quinone oxidoreductase subunit C
MAETLHAERIQALLQAALPGCSITLIANGSPSAQHSLLVDADHAVATARFLRDDPRLRLDFCSNVTGVDRLDSEVTEKTKVTTLVDGVEREVEETRKTTLPGYLEAVYHLYSIEKKSGPVILRLRTSDRGDRVHLPSLTSIWRSAEFQEREIFDLYGIVFDGHPDLRRILMWEEFAGHPMRKDYLPPADDELELLAVSQS